MKYLLDWDKMFRFVVKGIIVSETKLYLNRKILIFKNLKWNSLGGQESIVN